MQNQNENREVAIQLSGVRKMYKLGQIGGGTLQGDIQSWWARVRKKEDPNTKIGTNQRLIGQTFMALNGIDLTVYKGEALGIIGGNGAGKSTMLKLLSRVTAPTEGDIDIYGRIASMLEVGTGFNGELTGRENVYMNGAILGMTKAEIDAKMEDIIEFSEVREFIDTPVKRYSSGMYVKLAFSVAAHLDSEIMIMDEVLAVGDMAFQNKCLTKMRDAASKEGRTVLYVSHNMNTIRQLCDRCVVLDKGKVIFQGDVEDAISIYMNSESNTQVALSYEHAKVPTWLQYRKLALHNVTFEGKKYNQFAHAEPMKLKFQWTALQDIEDICLRIEVLTLEGTIVGSYTANDICSCKEHDEVETVVELDTSLFVDSAYKMRYNFFNHDTNGNTHNIEYQNGLCFTIDSRKDGTELVWDLVHWGHLHFPNPKVCALDIQG